MALSGKERQRRWKNNLHTSGKKTVTVNISMEAYNILKTHNNITNKNYSDIIDSALTRSSIYSENVEAKGIKLDSTDLFHLAENKIPQKIKRKDGLKRIEQIMAASLRLFSEQGYNATTIEDIINEIGIARRTLYLHFNGKNEILMMIIESFTNDLKSAAEVLAKSILSNNAPIDMKQIACISVQNIIDQPELKMFAKLVLGEIVGLQGIFFEKVNYLFDIIYKIASETIRTAQKNSITSKKNVDPVAASFCCIGGLKEILYQKLVAGKNIDLDEAISSLIEIAYSSLFD